MTLKGYSTLIMIIIWFLLPLKYGGNVNPTETSMWNQDLFSWFIASWPTFTFPFISAISLVVILINRRGFSRNSLLFCLLMIFPGIMILIASLIGWINTTENDVAYLFSMQIFAIVILVSASIIFIQSNPKARNLILISICAGFLVSSVIAWYQKYYLYPMVQQNIESQLEKGEKIDSRIISGLKTKQFSGSFNYPNHLGAHLILLFPLSILLAWRSGNYVEPKKTSRFVISISILTFIMGTLRLSGSLASVLILTLILLGMTIYFFIKKNCRGRHIFIHKSIYILVTLLFAICLGFIFQEIIIQSGKLPSLSARFKIWHSAIQMFKENPMVGVGVGDFYNHFLQNKPADTLVTRFAHNLFLCFLSQCGIFGGIAALTMLLYPFWLIILIMIQKLKIQSEPLALAVFGGSFAWASHSLLDFNIQVPATVSTFLFLPSLCLDFKKDDLIMPIRKFIPIGISGLFLIGICLIPIKRIAGEKNYKTLNQLIKENAPIKQIFFVGEKASYELPNSPYPASKIAQVAMQTGHYEYAIEKLKESIRRTPHRSTYYSWIAQVYLKMGNKNDALENIELALLWYPTNEEYRKIRTFIKNS